MPLAFVLPKLDSAFSRLAATFRDDNAQNKFFEEIILRLFLFMLLNWVAVRNEHGRVGEQSYRIGYVREGPTS